MAGRILNKRDQIITDSAMLPRIYDDTHQGGGSGKPAYAEYYLEQFSLDAGSGTDITLDRVGTATRTGTYNMIAVGGLINDEPNLTGCNCDDVEATCIDSGTSQVNPCALGFLNNYVLGYPALSWDPEVYTQVLDDTSADWYIKLVVISGMLELHVKIVSYNKDHLTINVASSDEQAHTLTDLHFILI